MYLMWAVELGMTNITIPANILDVAYRSHLWSEIFLLISWCSFSAVKLSFMVFFKKLINRMKTWQIYWWVVFTYTVCVLIYGSLVFFISCPYFYSPKENTCTVGRRKDMIMQESISLAVLDVVGDALILAIPINVIWKIRVRWGQKLFLILSLCLTVIMIILSIVRVCGLVYHDMIDTVWETYWQFLSAEVGVFLASAVSFRSLFVSQRSHSGPNYSVRKMLKNSFQSPKRRNTGSLSDSWWDAPGNEMDSLPNNAFTEDHIAKDGNYVNIPHSVHAGDVDLEGQAKFVTQPTSAIVKTSRDERS
ncbi:hypothetical protein N7490_003541 [Penicillium lividum]|nr:hypothetical protein N7490_003541 [Penicillium lividum]